MPLRSTLKTANLPGPPAGDLEIWAEILRFKVRSGGSVTLNQDETKALLAVLEDGLRQKEDLSRICQALDHLSTGCAYPREIRRRLREISSGGWCAPERVPIETQNGGFDSIWGHFAKALIEEGISNVEYVYRGEAYRVGFRGKSVYSVTLISTASDTLDKCLWKESQGRRRLSLRLREVIAGAQKRRAGQTTSSEETLSCFHDG